MVQGEVLMEKGPLYEIRGSLVEDQAQILQISRHLNTVNLPEEEEGVHQILDASQKSFTQAIKDPLAAVEAWEQPKNQNTTGDHDANQRDDRPAESV